MSDTLLGLDPASEPQWRLAEVQVVNWGTFDGLHRIPIARKGHLITGPSGSGKSSLLDAIAAVLTPDRWLRFNDAAQSSGTRGADRSLVSYVRGAWSRGTDETQDRVVSRYLRERGTFSGILLRYDDGHDATVSLARLFHLKGTSNEPGDLRDLCIVERGTLDLSDLLPFVQSGPETRRLKDAFPQATVTSNRSHSPFYAKMQSLLGIPSANALLLLHKTQSAKNLGRLDQLFRSFMLDEPETFARAKTATEQFGELNAAHHHVADLREQRDALRSLHETSQRFEHAASIQSTARALLDAVPGFENSLRLTIARSERDEAQRQLAGLTEGARAASVAERAAEEALRTAQQREDRLGGSDVTQLHARIADSDAAHVRVTARWELLRERLASVQIDHVPRTPAEYAELRASAEAELAQPAPEPAHTHPDTQRYFEAKRERERVDRELEVLKHSRSNLSPALQRERTRLARELGVTEAALPFAGELIEVLPEFADWTGAIERVLRPLASALLVREDLLVDVRRSVDSRHLGTRLVFEVVTRGTSVARGAASDASLINRVRVADGGFRDWLEARLAKGFDFACVAGPDEFDDHERAVTIHGQVKQSAARYEKNDSVAVTERTSWILGGDNDAKVQALLEQRSRAVTDETEFAQRLDLVSAQIVAATKRRAVLEHVTTQGWSDYDQAAAADETHRLREQLRTLTVGNSDYTAAAELASLARLEHQACQVAAAQAEQDRRSAQSRVDDIAEVIARSEEALADGSMVEPEASLAAALDERYRKHRRKLDRVTLADVGRRVEAGLRAEADRAATAVQDATNEFVRGAARFAQRWPAASADLTGNIEDRASYRGLLESIESRGLPEHESNFLRLLREKSSNVIGYLLSDLRTAPGLIKERVQPVNFSLGRSEFDRDKFLRINVRTRRSETVTSFMSDLRTIADGSWDDSDLVAAERRFSVLAEIIRRFGSSERVDTLWRSQVLDTREHVDFHAEVVDRAGRVTATYDSGAALSGGQQQKLVVFCLAAALRYQLTTDEDAAPRYGTVILDEAFDKADSSYTRMAMDIFVEFGFHMILATPQKLLQTIEPYVGAITAVSNPTERSSQLANATFGEAHTP
ncbi:MAG: ATP-binding protein [Rhodoglobus sp.]